MRLNIKLSILLSLLFSPYSTVCGNEFIHLGFLSTETERYWSVAHGVDATGLAVIGTSNTPLGPTAFIWRDESSIVQISNSQHLVTATAISADGTTIVGQAMRAEMPGEPFIWSSSGGLQ